jgi:hypothetical protein
MSQIHVNDGIKDPPHNKRGIIRQLGPGLLIAGACAFYDKVMEN